MRLEDYVRLFRRYLRSHGYHITQTRERIAAETFRMPEHFDAATLLTRLRERGLRVGAATVYRTLELLSEAGLVRRFSFQGRTWYEASLGRPHHEHLLCTRCGRVVEFSDAALEERLMEVVEAQAFLHQSHQVLVYGLCPACRGREAGGDGEGVKGAEGAKG